MEAKYALVGSFYIGKQDIAVRLIGGQSRSRQADYDAKMMEIGCKGALQ